MYMEKMPPPVKRPEKGRGRGRLGKEGRKVSMALQARGRGRPSNATSRDKSRTSIQPRQSRMQQQSRMKMSTLSVARDLRVERTQTMTKCKKVIIAVIILLIVLAGTGAGVYFGLIYETTPTAPKTTPAPVTTFTSTTQATTTTREPQRVTTESNIADDKWTSIRGDCGRPMNKPSLGRVVGGTEAIKHSWPWQIGLLKYKRYDANTVTVKAICGGTLVGPKFAITATHCFLNSGRTKTTTDSDAFRVLVGGHDKGRETHGAKMLELDGINHHPKNNLATFTRMRQIPVHDITVLVLKTIVDPNVVSPMTSFACLPKPKVIPPVGKKCWATGWGKTQGTGSPKQLKQVVQPIVSENKCKKKYGSKGISEEVHLCAGPHKGSEGTCQGDSGGPLVCQGDDGAWVLHGDTSFGPQPCGISPGVWAQVSYHMDWLLDELPMIYCSCVFLYAINHHTRMKNDKSLRYIALLICFSIFVTIVYLYWQNPVFHQVCYASLVLYLLYEAIKAGMNYPQIIPVAGASLVIYATGFVLWNIDNVYCSSLRHSRANLPHPLFGPVTQLHAWWHLLTGVGTYLHILFSAYARTLHLKRKCSIQMLWGVWPYLEVGDKM